MSVARPDTPWDTSEYLRIAQASFNAGELVVRFVDGTEARVDVERMTRVQAQGPDWPALAFNDDEVIVPTGEGDFEISSFSIRSLSDPAFRAHLEAKEAESARRVGRRVRELRRGRNLTIETLAERAGIAAPTLSRIERGDHDGALTDLQRVVEAMGHSLKDLVIPEVEEPRVARAHTA
jgi:DNA-binding XRE family transcriptional regulator